MLSKVNEFFFGEEEICLSDSIWFYGFYSLMAVVLMIVLISNIQLFFI